MAEGRVVLDLLEIISSLANKVQEICTGSGKRSCMKLADLLSPDLIFEIQAGSKNEVIEKLIAHLYERAPQEIDQKSFLSAVLQRETLVSTGIGGGVAIPHARVELCTNFFMALALIHHPIEWGSVDEKPVNLVFLIGGPANTPGSQRMQPEYLNILAEITSKINKFPGLILMNKSDLIKHLSE